MRLKNIKYFVALILILAILVIPIMYYRNKIANVLDVNSSPQIKIEVNNVTNENPISVSTIKTTADSVHMDTIAKVTPPVTDIKDKIKDNLAPAKPLNDTVARESQPEIIDNNEEMVQPSQPSQDNAHLPVMEQPEPNVSMEIGNSISNDKSVESKPVTLKKRSSLMVYPTSGNWQQMFIIYPVKIPVKINSGSFLTRTFDGVTYPSIRNIKLHWHGKEYLVMLLKVKGTQTSDQRPFYIYLNSDAKFVIFGDYANRNKWYVYENNTVSHFTIPAEMQKDSL